MSLSNMYDIAGCRSIVSSIPQILSIVEDFEKNEDFEIIDRKDYIREPKLSGYISYHLIVKSVKEEKLLIEIQLRTREMHNWATLVEITDLIFDIKLKEGQNHDKLFQFHKLLSSPVKEMSLEEKEKLIEIEKELDIVKKLISLFKSSYESVERWSNSVDTESEYLIMELDENLIPFFTFFNSYETAENTYFNKFSINEPNMVLIHTNKLDYEKLGLAYSNYVLTSHPSIKLFLKILSDVTILSKEKGLYNNYSNHFKYFEKISQFIVESFENELLLFKNQKNNLNNDDLFDSWMIDLENRVKFFKEYFADTLKRINDTPAIPFFRRFFN